MKNLFIAFFMFMLVATIQAASLIETQNSKYGGAYQQMSYTGVQHYCSEVLDAAKYPNTNRISTVNQKYGVIVQPTDGSLRFTGITPLVVRNTNQNIMRAVRDVIGSSRRMLELGSSVNQPLGPYEVTSECLSSLMWLQMAIDPRVLQNTHNIEIDPNPMNQLPAGWEKSIKKAEINTTRADWRAALSGFDPH